MATLRKPKAKKLPKVPKAGASSEQIKKIAERTKAVKKENADALAAYEKEKKARVDARKSLEKERTK